MATHTAMSLPEMKRQLGRVDSLKGQVEKHKEKISELGRVVVDASVTGGAGFVIGAIEGYAGPVEPLGVPLPLAIAILGHGAGAVMGKKGRTLHAAANGGLALFGGTMGREVGAKIAARGGKAHPELTEGKTSGDNATGEGLTPEEKRAIQEGRAR